MRVQAPAEACQRRADGEDARLVGCHVHAHGLRRDFAAMHRAQRASHAGVDQVQSKRHHAQRGRPCEKVIARDGPEFKRAQSQARDARYAVIRSRDVVSLKSHVLAEENVDHDPQSQGRHRKIMAA